MPWYAVYTKSRFEDRVHAGLPGDRRVHLVLENDKNQAGLLERTPDGRSIHYDAQWNDDMHHCFHVLATGEKFGYYGDYKGAPVKLLGRCLAEGFAYQGEPSAHRGGRRRGEVSRHLPPDAFVSFLQNHDQVGNRAFGERLSVLAPDRVRRVVTAVLLLSPQVPLLFMGEEWGTRRPFMFFCDFVGDLAAAVCEGRRKEFSAFPRFREPAAVARIPDPNEPATAERSILDWEEPDKPEYAGWLAFYRHLLTLRKERIIPLVPNIISSKASIQLGGGACLVVNWLLSGNRNLGIVIFCSSEKERIVLDRNDLGRPGEMKCIYRSDGVRQMENDRIELEPWSVSVFLLE